MNQRITTEILKLILIFIYIYIYITIQFSFRCDTIVGYFDTCFTEKKALSSSDSSMVEFFRSRTYNNMR